MRYNSNITLQAAESLVNAIMVCFVVHFPFKQISAGDVAAVADVGKKDCNGRIQWHTNQSPFGE